MSDNEIKQELATLLVQHQKGIAHKKVSEELREAVAAVMDQGKAAKVVLEVKIEPVKNNPSVVGTTITSTAKIPKPAPVPAIYFPDEEGGLHRNNPEQREFDYGPDTTPTDGKSAAAGKDN